jgi:predicted Ser/Thr protein kinase
MKSYNIEVTETLSRVIEVEAESIDNALIKVNEMYKNEKIVLSSEDFVDVEILHACE